LRLAGLLLPFTALMIAAGSLFIPGLFTHLYDASIPIFRVAVLSALFAALPLEAVLRATGLTRYMFNVFFWRLLVTAAFVFTGLHFFGMMGAISGHVVAEAMVRSAMLDRIRRELGATWREILPWGELGNLLVASVISCAPVVAIARYSQASARPLFALFVAGAAYGVVYLSFSPSAPDPGRRSSASSAPCSGLTRSRQPWPFPRPFLPARPEGLAAERAVTSFLAWRFPQASRVRAATSRTSAASTARLA